MIVTDWFYCNQYQELVNTGRDGKKARKNGLILSSVCFTLNVMTVVYLLSWAGDLLWTSFDDIETYASGKTLGEAIGLLLIIAFYLLLKYTRGSEAYFHKVIERYRGLSEVDQKDISKKAYIYMFGSIIAMMICIFL
ncbi:MAG TPA: hypothetical protein PKM63_16255 [Panacibacter sp.]|nr:hypothetical protein [Panacibacter sp.]HNP45846.1 hypothetical protein [Panacibacter sp.]